MTGVCVVMAECPEKRGHLMMGEPVAFSELHAGSAYLLYVLIVDHIASIWALFTTPTGRPLPLYSRQSVVVVTNLIGQGLQQRCPDSYPRPLPNTTQYTPTNANKVHSTGSNGLSNSHTTRAATATTTTVNA